MSKATPKVHFVSLGCPKNRVDSEVMLGHLVRDGYRPVDQAEGADVVVVNTCAFIDAAKEESVDAILEIARMKDEGKVAKIVVAGCMSQRYAPELASEIPEVDHFLGTGNFESIAQVLRAAETPSRAKGRASLPVLGQAKPAVEAPSDAKQARSRRNAVVPFRHEADPKAARPIVIPDPDFTLTAASPRVATQPFWTTYLKVSEGCSNQCAFCIIPKLRGAQRSRSIDDLAIELAGMRERGAVEVNLIAQDLCAYGKDLAPQQSLAELLRVLDRVGSERDQPFWLRMLYAYPKGLTTEVMEVMASSRHVVPYLDMPLQHISDGILRRMKRGKGGESTKDLLRKLRRTVPGLVLRTTFITGLPGETEADFAELCELVEELRFERMGVFAYSPEEDTPAATMSGQVPHEVAEARRVELMELQRRISREQHEALVGKTLAVLVDGPSEETELLLQGRHSGQAPEIDGLTYITEGTASPGEVVQVLIEQAADYDLAGRIVGPA